MNNLDGMNFLKDILNEDLSIDSQVSALFDILENEVLLELEQLSINFRNMFHLQIFVKESML